MRSPGHFDWRHQSCATCRPDVSTGATRAIELGGRRVDLLNLGPQHTTADRRTADAGVLFAGDLLFTVAPRLRGESPIANWGGTSHAMVLDAHCKALGMSVTGLTGPAVVCGYLVIAEQAEAAYRGTSLRGSLLHLIDSRALSHDPTG